MAKLIFNIESIFKNVLNGIIRAQVSDRVTYTDELPDGRRANQVWNLVRHDSNIVSIC